MTRNIEVYPKDNDNKNILVAYDPLGNCRNIPVTDGNIDLSALQDTKYCKYITGISPRENDDTYDVVLTPEGRRLWDEETVRIGQWMRKWSCD